MTPYVYETIPQKPGAEPRRFEVRQSMSDARSHPASRDGRTCPPGDRGRLRFYRPEGGAAAAPLRLPMRLLRAEL